MGRFAASEESHKKRLIPNIAAPKLRQTRDGGEWPQYEKSSLVSCLDPMAKFRKAKARQGGFSWTLTKRPFSPSSRVFAKAGLQGTTVQNTTKVDWKTDAEYMHFTPAFANTLVVGSTGIQHGFNKLFAKYTKKYLFTM